MSIGLISYSAYLWHQPLLSFSKIYSVKNLSDLDKVTVIIATFLISFATWKFIEKPFRDKSKVSALVIWCSSFVLICLFSGIGYWFHKTNGVPNRIFTQYEFERSTHENKIVDLENHIDSNSRLLIIGDSFARDIAYLFSYQHPEIRFRLRNLGSENGVVEQTFCKGEFVRFLSSEGIDKVFVAFDEGYEISCISKLNEEIKENNLRILFVGTKNFGENLNWLSRLDRYERANLCQPAADNYRMIDMRDDKFIPDDYYLSFISLVNDSMCVPITNKNGELLASDLKHLTIAGVEFFSPIFFSQNNVRRLLEK